MVSDLVSVIELSGIKGGQSRNVQRGSRLTSVAMPFCEGPIQSSTDISSILYHLYQSTLKKGDMNYLERARSLSQTDRMGSFVKVLILL